MRGNLSDQSPTTSIEYLASGIHRADRGFTLVEALCAGVILSLAAMVLGAAMTRTMHALNNARDNQRAVELLDRTLTKIDMIGPGRITREGPTLGRFEGMDGRFSWRTRIRPRLDGNLYDVAVEIAWDTPRGRRRVEAYTRLNDALLSRNSSLQWEQF